MEYYQEEFVEFLANSGALFFRENLRLKDGRHTPYFINLGEINTGKRISLLAGYFAGMLTSKDLIRKGDILFGPSYKGSALAVATSIALVRDYDADVFVEYDRKEAKTHGESSGQESALVNKTLYPSCNIVMIDDVLTSGKTKEESIERIVGEAKKLGYEGVKIKNMCIAVDREQVGPVYDLSKPKEFPNSERIIHGERGEDAVASFVEKTGIPVQSIIGIRKAVNFLYSSQTPLDIDGIGRPMDPETFNNFFKYMKIYGAKR